jgi:hypothetical protein
MGTGRRTTPRRLGEGMRRKLEVTSALAWEALVDTHVEQAAQFVTRLLPHWPVEEALPRYLREMDLDETMVAAIRTRVLVRVEEAEGGDAAGGGGALAGGGTSGAQPRGGVPGPGWGDGASDGGEEDSAWGLLRQPARMVRGVMARQRRNEEVDRIVQLSLARAEEQVIRTHVENAISVVALLEEQFPLDRCVQQYLGAVGLYGGRAQTVLQRTMARLADVHL